MTSMTDHASQTQVPYDTTWKNILECATIEVFEMMGWRSTDRAVHCR
ncbi:MAG: hypothetical protein WA211_09425 [Candidatus Acidiferrales bacterium]